MAQHMGIFEFGEKLLETNDLDPVYVAVHGAKFPKQKLEHWLLAYWCFYHVGTASWIVEQPDYWLAMEQAAGSKEWPRSSERRHFRGQQALDSVAWLRSQGVDTLLGPLQAQNLDSLIMKGKTQEIKRNQLTLAYVQEKVKQWRGFGEWISFKVADMIDRLGITKVHFSPSDIFNIFDSPRKGAELMAEVHGPVDGSCVYTWAYKCLKNELGHWSAPPLYERDINIQEIETILCKWKSHMSGHYEVGKDIAEVRHGLLKFARCRTSQQLIAGGKRGLLW